MCHAWVNQFGCGRVEDRVQGYKERVQGRCVKAEATGEVRWAGAHRVDPAEQLGLGLLFTTHWARVVPRHKVSMIIVGSIVHLCEADLERHAWYPSKILRKACDTIKCRPSARLCVLYFHALTHIPIPNMTLTLHRHPLLELELFWSVPVEIWSISISLSLIFLISLIVYCTIMMLYLLMAFLIYIYVHTLYKL